MASTLDLTSLSNDSFDSIVNQDVRGSLDSSTSKLLRQPENLNRWYDTLLSIKRTVEAQLAASRAELIQKQVEFLPQGSSGKMLFLQERVTTERWRKGTIRFKNGVEDKLAEAKRLRAEHHKHTYVDVLVRDRDRAMREALRLRTAIVSHRQTVDGDEEQAGNADEELWKAIDSTYVKS